MPVKQLSTVKSTQQVGRAHSYQLGCMQHPTSCVSESAEDCSRATKSTRIVRSTCTMTQGSDTRTPSNWAAIRNLVSQTTRKTKSNRSQVVLETGETHA
jgi:hypothetical protein